MCEGEGAGARGEGDGKRFRFAEGFGAMEVPFAFVALPLGLMFFISGFILNVLQVRKEKKRKGKGMEGYGVGWDGLELCWFGWGVMTMMTMKEAGLSKLGDGFVNVGIAIFVVCSSWPCCLCCRCQGQRTEWPTW